MNSLFNSATYTIRGARFLRQHPILWKYAAAPVVISFVVLGSSYGLLYYVFKHFADSFQGSRWYGEVLYYLLLVILGLAVLVIFFFVFGRVASAIAGPFNDILSQRTEELVSGQTSDAPFSVLSLFKDSARSLYHSLRILGLYAGFMLAALALLLAPGIGGIAYTVLGALISAFMFAYEYLGYPMDRRRLSWAEKRAFMRAKIRPVMGFGLGVVAFASIPFVNLLFIPAAVVGGTLLFLELDGRP